MSSKPSDSESADRPDGEGEAVTDAHSGESRASVASGIGPEINSILPGKNPMKNLKARQTGANHYSVLSARNGSVTVHRVNLAEPSCTCEDMEYNREDNEVCAHVAKAALVHPQMDATEAAVVQLNGQLSRIETVLSEVQEIRDQADAAAKEAGAKARAKEATEARDDDSPGAPPERDSSPSVDPEDAADRLKDAYDDVVDDMQVTTAAGRVWVQTGKDTPDNLKMPGAPETFATLLQQPDQVTYVHDDHRLASEKPGEWWKNAIEPSDVDSYISEVLQA